MTQDKDALALVRRVVTVVDIRSSTSILEDLKQTDNLKRWRDLLIKLKQLLSECRENLGLEPYKFIGDGWILLFPENITQSDFIQFIRDFSLDFQSIYVDSVAPFLQRTPEKVGLTFGVDAGELVQLEMNEQTEYLGRAINLAARLQDAAKKIEGSSNYQALFSKNSFNAMPSPLSSWNSSLRGVEVSLRNVANGERYVCVAYDPLSDEILPRPIW